jgi:hypothetical protein
MTVTTMTNLPIKNPKRAGRQAQGWAQQLLAGIKEQLEARNHPMNFIPPFTPRLEGKSIVLANGAAIRTCQEVNLAIKQHNQLEQERADAAFEAQVAEAKRSKSGTVYTQSYEPTFVYWRLQSSAISEAERELWVGLPQLSRNRGQSALGKLAEKFFLGAVAGSERDVTTAQVKEDPFERMMRGEHLEKKGEQHGDGE